MDVAACVAVVMICWVSMLCAVVSVLVLLRLADVVRLRRLSWQAVQPVLVKVRCREQVMGLPFLGCG